MRYLSVGGIAGLIVATCVRCTEAAPALPPMTIFSFSYRPPVPATFTDADADGLADDWERLHGLDPRSPADAAQDYDGDGLSALDEYRADADPWCADTDADGCYDGAAVPPLAAAAAAPDLENRIRLHLYAPEPR